MTEGYEKENEHQIEGKKKRNENLFSSIMRPLIIIGVTLLVIGTIYLVYTRCFKKQEVVMDGNTITYERVFTEKQFIDTVAWVDANGHELIDESYPETVFYLRNGQVDSKVFETFDEYLDFLIEVRYSDTLKLHKLSIPKFVIYK